MLREGAVMDERTAVGVDAGGTTTVAAAQTARGVAIARAEGANPTVRGRDAASATIVRVVREATGGRAPDSVYVGAAGAGGAVTAAALRAELQSAFGPAATVFVADDVRIALRAAIPEGPGVVLVAGTGSVAYAEAGDRTLRVGGAGWLLGDDGSGFALGLAALRTCMRSFDERLPAGALAALVARSFDAADREALLARVHDGAAIDVARIAALARPVVALASDGDRAATKLVQGASVELADLVRVAVRRIGLAEASPRAALVGGLLRENSVLTFLLETRLVGDVPGIAIVRSGAEDDGPARAALRFACEQRKRSAA